MKDDYNKSNELKKIEKFEEFEKEDLLSKISFEKSNGLVPAIVQDMESKKVLMLAYMNKPAFLRTLETKKACFWSRSRKKPWMKGESSGNFLFVQELMVDCDFDTILLLVNPVGPVCHTGNVSCFFRKMVNEK